MSIYPKSFQHMEKIFDFYNFISKEIIDAH